MNEDLAELRVPSRDLVLFLAAARLRACSFFCCCSADSFLVTAYLKSNSPLFSMVNEADFLEWTTMDPKLMSLMGEMEKREKTALAVILIGMLAMTSPLSPMWVSITWGHAFERKKVCECKRFELLCVCAVSSSIQMFFNVGVQTQSDN